MVMTLRQCHDVMKDQARVAEIAANAAKESADVARKALHVAERPHFDIVNFKVSPIPFEAHKPISYGGSIHNSGRTAAYEVEGGIYISITGTRISDESKLVYLPFGKPPSKIPIGAGRSQERRQVTAGLDLALALVEEDLGRDIAKRVASQLVMFFKRPGGQSQFSRKGEAAP